MEVVISVFFFTMIVLLYWIKTPKPDEMRKPKLITKPDLTDLKAKCEKLVEFIDESGHDEEGIIRKEYSVLESAMEAFYGKKIYKWADKRITEKIEKTLK